MQCVSLITLGHGAQHKASRSKGIIGLDGRRELLDQLVAFIKHVHVVLVGFDKDAAGGSLGSHGCS